MWPRRWWMLSIVLVALALACTGLGAWVALDARPVQRDLGRQVVTSFHLERVVLTHQVGRLLVQAGPPGEVQVAALAEAKGLPVAEARGLLQQARVRLQTDADERVLYVNASAPEPAKGSLSLHLTLTVPAGITLVVQHGVGQVRFTGVDATVHLQQGVGEVVWEGGLLDAGSLWQVEVGEVTWRGRLPDQGRVSIQVEVGSLLMRLPPEPSVQVDARVATGSLTVQGPAQPVQGSDAWQADLGTNPQARLQLRVTTGSLRVQIP